MSTFFVNKLVEEKCKVLPWYRACCERFLAKFLPAKIKRLVFLTSIYGYIKNQSNVSDEILHKLNIALSLSRDERAMRLPLVIKDVVWRDLDVKTFDEVGEVITDPRRSITYMIKANHLDKLTEILIQYAPSWTIYGSQRLIKKDVRLLVKEFA